MIRNATADLTGNLNSFPFRLGLTATQSYADASRGQGFIFGVTSENQGSEQPPWNSTAWRDKRGQARVGKFLGAA